MATKEQIPTLAGEMVKNQGGFKALSTDDAQSAILDMPAFISCACLAWKNRNMPSQNVVAEIANPIQTEEEQLSEWQRFYAEVFGDNDVRSINPDMPPEKEGFNWLIVIRKGLTMNEVLKVMRTKFTVSCRIGDNLDEGVPVNDRIADKDYVIRIRDRTEADEELKSRSAYFLLKENILTLTLLERLVLDLFYFWKNGEHLDIENLTLCAGSRYSDGDVPNVCWSLGARKVCIDWCNPVNSYDLLRARAAVVG